MKWTGFYEDPDVGATHFRRVPGVAEGSEEDAAVEFASRILAGKKVVFWLTPDEELIRVPVKPKPSWIVERENHE
jgi:hypothetical protein